MSSVGGVAGGLQATSAITTRKDFERWRKRSISRRKFLLTAFLIGAVPVFVAGLTLVIAAAIVNRDQLHSIEPILIGFVGVFLGSTCCAGSIIFIPCWLLLSTGLGNFKQVMAQLKENGRVCEVCESVSMFEDKYVNPSKRKGHTADDLVPHMNVIEEDGKVNVLCDACLAEVSAIEQ